MAETPPLAATDASPATHEHSDRPADDAPGLGAEPLWRDALGDCLRDLRRGRGEKLSDTAGRAGISPQYLSEMERGVKDPSSEMIAAVAGALDLSLVDLTVAVAERLRTGEITASVSYGSRSAYALAA
ncbi:helix-turn-helix domain-containing protein [Glycomyces harbinensis]|uniref:Transcriptional regulator, contains XRE-family HTH domain n=1 Tax=Glycomyces harbinensis TaxID=58114 RepID=A0A1G6VWF6_9ACTN|nr:helix-turn-helix transcriptional regulator [Glycomyces harbinensis]SDD57972.1 Transcriptional regulator, contains XRE-family HTH domain [Glycomyces harbinensis]